MAYWLRLIQSEKKLIRGIVSLARALDCPKQIALHKTLYEERKPSAKAVCLCIKAAEQAKVLTKWDFVANSRKLLLGLHKIATDL